MSEKENSKTGEERYQEWLSENQEPDLNQEEESDEESSEEEEQTLAEKAAMLQALAAKASSFISWVIGLINPLTLIIIGVILAIVVAIFGVLGFVQTIGRNEHACADKTDCSVAEAVGSCEDSINAGNFSGWPAGAEPRSKEAGKAVLALVENTFKGVPGWTEEHTWNMVTISWFESGWDPNAMNGKSSATGLFQVLASHDGSKSREAFKDPQFNADWAKRLYIGSNGFTPWAVWPGTHLKDSGNQDAGTFNNQKREVKALLGGETGGGNVISVGGCASGAVGTCGPGCDKALAGAKAMLNDCNGWDNACAAFSGRAAGWTSWCGPVSASEDGNGSCSAADGYFKAKRLGAANPITDWNTVPAGAFLIRPQMPGGSIHGHVAVMSDKPGYVYTTVAEGAPAGTCIKEFKLTDTRFDIKLYVWVDPDKLA